MEIPKGILSILIRGKLICGVPPSPAIQRMRNDSVLKRSNCIEVLLSNGGRLDAVGIMRIFFLKERMSDIS